MSSQVKRLTDQAYTNAKNLLKKHEDKLHKLAKLLTDKETLTGDEVREALGIANKKPQSPAAGTILGGGPPLGGPSA
jgi:cell division protease FtsH